MLIIKFSTLILFNIKNLGQKKKTRIKLIVDGLFSHF